MAKKNLPPLTIKGVSIAAQGAFKTLYTEEVNRVAETAGEAFEKVMQVYQGKPKVNSAEAQAKIDELVLEVEELRTQNSTLNTAGEEAVKLLEETNAKLLEAITSLEAQIKINGGLTEEIIELKATPPEKETVEVEKPLSKGQFILEVHEDLQDMARKCRPFLVKDGRITTEASKNPADFFNDLFELACKNYLNTKYNNIL